MNAESIILHTCVLLTIFGSALMLLHLVFFDILQQFSQRLIFCLSISDLIYGIALLLYIDPPQNGYDQTRCKISGALTQFSTISTFLWSFTISYVSFVSITKQGRERLSKFEKYQIIIFILGFFIPLALASVPWFLDAYNPTPKNDPTTCSIRQDDIRNPEQTEEITLYLNLYIFYIPLIILVFISLLYALRSIWRTHQQKSDNSLISQRIEIQSYFAKTLTLYPLILVVCWLPSLVVFFISITQLDIIEVGQVIKLLQYGMSFLQGFGNSMVYYYNTSTLKKKIYNLEMQKEFLKQQTATLFSNNNNSIDESVVANSFENLQDL